MNVDRDLLFGVLAVQADLIDAAEFVEVCAYWITHKHVPLAQVLIERGFITAADQAEVERLMQRKLKKHGQDAQSTLSILVGADLRASLVGLNDPDIGKIVGGPARIDSRLATPIPPIPLTRDRYSLTRMHATGGIGRVWLARDAQIGRDVALKELRPEHAGHPAYRTRFVREAQVTGQLEHPGIVPVYELATRPGSQQPFYTMRFVQGQTLSAAARTYREKRAAGAAGAFELRGLINAFVAVCNAVSYAHARGVVHRDLKGDNVILGDFGEVIVLDWGLAKILGRAEQEAAAPVVLNNTDSGYVETLQGEIMGTPAFMPPEQAAGQSDRIDQRSDVYGLGAILYEVLTGQAPFSGGSPYEVVQTVREREPAPPRQACPDVPRPLEAICLRAMAKKPEDRYSSARALAQDVQRWLADEPVEAYREPLAARIGRWGRRHKTAVTAAAALLLTATAALSCSTVLIAREQKLTEQARLGESEQREQAQKSLAMACQAVDEMLTQVGQDRLAELPGMDNVRRELLGKALAFYQRFLERNSNDPHLRLETGRAYRRLASIYQMLGQPPKGLEESTASLEILNSLVTAFPQQMDYQFELARCHQNQGRLLEDLGRYADALAEDRESSRIFGELWKQNKQEPAYAEAWADSDTNLGNTLSVMEQRAEAAEAYDRALQTYDELAKRDPPNLEYRRAKARAQNNLGLLLFAGRDYNGAAATYREGIRNLNELVSRTPAESDIFLELSVLHNNLGRALAAAGQLKEAVTAYRDAGTVLTRLVNNYPIRPDYRKELANTLSYLVPVLAGLGRREEAATACRQAQNLLGRLSADFPARPDYRHNWALTYTNLGKLFQDAKKYEEAESAYREGVRILSDLANIPDRPMFRRTLAASLANLAALQQERGRSGDAVQTARQVVQVWKKLVDEFRMDPNYRSELGVNLQYLANLLGKQGQVAEARSLLEQAIDHQQTASRLNRDSQDYRRLLGDHYGYLAEACLQLGDTAAAAQASLELHRLRPDDSYRAACLLARCTAAVGRNGGLPEDQRNELAQRYGGQAVELLRETLQKRIHNVNEIEQNSDLAILRDRPDYRSLVAELNTKKSESK